MADASAVGKSKKKGGLANLLKKRKSKKKAASLDDLNATAPSSSPSPAVGPSSEVMIVDRTLASASVDETDTGSPGVQRGSSSGATVTVGVVASKSEVGTFEPDLESLDAGRTIRTAVRKHQTRLDKAGVAEEPKTAAAGGMRRYVAGAGRTTSQWGQKHEIPTLSEALGGGKAPVRSAAAGSSSTQPNMWTQLAMADGLAGTDASGLGASAASAVELLGEGMPAIQLTSTLCTGPVLTRPELIEAASLLAKDLRDDLKPIQRADEAVALKPIDGPEHRVQVAIAVLADIGEWSATSRAVVGPFLEQCLRKRAFTPNALCVALAEEVYPILPDMVCDAPRLYEYVASALEPLLAYQVLDVSTSTSPDIVCMPPPLRKAMKLEDADFEAKAAAYALAKAEAEAAAQATKAAKAKAAEEAMAAEAVRAAAAAKAQAEAKAAAEARSARVFVPSAARRSAGDAAAPTYSAISSSTAAGPEDEDGDGVAALLAASSGKKKKKSKKAKQESTEGAIDTEATAGTAVAVAVASDADVSELLMAAAGGKKKKKKSNKTKAESTE